MILSFQRLFFLFFLLTIPLFGQVDSSFIKKGLVAQSNFIEKNQDATINILPFIETYANKAIEVKDLNHEAKAYYYYCLVYRKKKNVARAHFFIDKAIVIARQKNDSYNSGIFLHRKGTVFYVNADNEKALEYYLKAYHLLNNKKTEPQRLLNLRYDIATINLKAKHYNEALIRFESIAKTYDSILKNQPSTSAFHNSYARVLLGLADAYTEQQNFKKALDTYDKALHISIGNEYSFGTYVALGGKGKVLNHKKEYLKALIPINEAIRMTLIDTTSKGILPFLYAHKGESYFGLKDYEKAILNFTKADSIVKADKLDYIELDYVLKLLAVSYKELKNYKKSSHFFDAYAAKNDLNDKERIKLRETLFNDFDLQHVSDKLENAKEEKSFFENRFYLSLFIIFCVSTLFIVFIIYHKFKQRKNKERFNELLKTLPTRETAQKTTKNNFVMSDDTSKDILEKLNHFEASELYLNKKYNLAALAKKFNTNSNYLSKIINTYKGKSFSQYLIDLRIEFIIIELKNNKKIRSYTIQAIAEEIGFNKAESFSRAFKKKTGFNPSYYIKNLENT